MFHFIRDMVITGEQSMLISSSISQTACQCHLFVVLLKLHISVVVMFHCSFLFNCFFVLWLKCKPWDWWTTSMLCCSNPIHIYDL